jgi:hypothetical protein
MGEEAVMVPAFLTDQHTVAPRSAPVQISSLTLDREYIRPANLATTSAITVPTVAHQCESPVLYFVWSDEWADEDAAKYALTQDVSLAPCEPSRISPSWLASQKTRVRSFSAVGENWDSDGAAAVNPLALVTAEAVLDWLALADVPPPDVFPTIEGGVQVEWHIYGLNAEVEISPNGVDAEIYFHDLRTREEWVRPLSGTWAELRTIRRRLLTGNG